MSLDSISRTIDRALTAAGLDTRAGVPKAVLQTIHDALQSAGMGPHPLESPPRADGGPEPAAPAPGRFDAIEHAGPRGRRSGKLYVPRAHDGTRRLPLVVMLHGCQQDPDDFARGTRMNEMAEEQGFLVAYPAQSRKANGSNCWRWFEPQQQGREGAEPSIIAGMVRQVMASHAVDERRVYVAGLSAGAAMALILADTYPDLFAAVGTHSGLPRGAAHDVTSAFAAMREGAARATPAAGRALPTIVFHGEADATVAPANAEVIVQQAVARLADERVSLTREQVHAVANGRRCTCVRHRDGDGTAWVEHWSVQGAGHLWFGGSPAGSFAGPEGPDASREMLRFFAAHARR